MSIEETGSETLLVNGLPALIEGDQYIVFSPYKRVFVTCDKEFIDSGCIDHLDIYGIPAKKEPSRLVDVGFVLTRDCNLRCIYCFAFGGELRDKIRQEYVEKAIEFIANRNPDMEHLRVDITGGEPTQHFKAIQWVVDSVSGLNISSTFYIGTNGVMSEKVLEYLIANSFYLHVSCDGTPNINDRLRPLPSGEGSSKYILKTIKRLVKDKANFKVRSTITKYSVQFMPDFVDYFADLGVKKIHFEGLDPWGKARRANLELPSTDSFVYYFMKALDRAKERGVSVFHDALVNLVRPSCHSCAAIGGRKIIILPDGTISRCWDVLDCDHPYSDIFLVGSYDPVQGSFRIDEAKAQRLEEMFSVDNMPDCEKCFCKYICSGACPIRHLFLNNCKDASEFSVSSEQCALSKGIIRGVLMRMYRHSAQ